MAKSPPEDEERQAPPPAKFFTRIGKHMRTTTKDHYNHGHAAAAAAAAAPESEGSSSGDLDQYNVFRDSWVRYMGYANEVGESFRFQAPRLVMPSYAVSGLYCCADAANASYEVYRLRQRTGGGGGGTDGDSAGQKGDSDRLHDATRAGLDVLLWQSLASVAIPGAIINAIVKASRFAIRRANPPVAAAVALWGPTIVGLCSIPVIITPIDHAVDYLMDHTTRKWWKAKSSQ